MPSRRSHRGRSRGARKRPIWVNIPFGAVAFTESVGNQALLQPEDWEPSFTGLSIDRAVLRAIVGYIVIQQTVVGTAGTTGFWGIYMNDAGSATVPTFTTSGMSEVDWLRTGAFGCTTSVTGSLSAAEQAAIPINITAKRRISSRDQIQICAQFGADAASPAGVLGGLLRFLVSIP